jgi:hypothetical protein
VEAKRQGRGRGHGVGNKVSVSSLSIHPIAKTRGPSQALCLDLLLSCLGCWHPGNTSAGSPPFFRAHLSPTVPAKVPLGSVSRARGDRCPPAL